MAASTDRGGVRIITIENPPVNALSFAYCAELLDAVRAAEADERVSGIVFAGANGIFSAGADVNDFNAPAPKAATLRDVVAAVEASEKPYAAAIDGDALGGALELALACDVRVATARSRAGFPEIRLGLIPGAGGTQRLPRLTNARYALELMLAGEPRSADAAASAGIFDDVVEGGVVDAAIARLDRAPKRRVSSLPATLGDDLPMRALPFVLAQAHKAVPAEDRGGYAAHKLVDALEAAVTMPFALGLAREARLFEEVVRSEASAALRHLFFARRRLREIPGLAKVEPYPVRAAGVVGAGTMGTGIAIAFASAGIPVTVFEADERAIETSKRTIFGTFAHAVRRGRIAQDQAWQLGRSIAFASDMAELADADVVVEAVFESMAVKKQVFAAMDGIARADALLASNTSTLDIDEMASVTARPERILGLHFFAPANVMPLMEVVRGAATSAQTLKTAFALAKVLGKTMVLSGNAFGFIGNRMAFDYLSAANALAEEGIAPWRVDAVMKRFGFPMGPFAASDLSGLDVVLAAARGGPNAFAPRTRILEELVEAGRLGQKSGAGYFAYDAAAGRGREPIRDEHVEAMYASEARRAGIVPCDAADGEICDRLIGALVDRGRALVDEGVALRAGDVDVVSVFGYGFPPYRGGPLWYAGRAKEPSRA